MTNKVQLPEKIEMGKFVSPKFVAIGTSGASDAKVVTIIFDDKVFAFELNAARSFNSMLNSVVS